MRRDAPAAHGERHSSLVELGIGVSEQALIAGAEDISDELAYAWRPRDFVERNRDDVDPDELALAQSEGPSTRQSPLALSKAGSRSRYAELSAHRAAHPVCGAQLLRLEQPLHIDIAWPQRQVKSRSGASTHCPADSNRAAERVHVQLSRRNRLAVVTLVRD